MGTQTMAQYFRCRALPIIKRTNDAKSDMAYAMINSMPTNPCVV